MALTLGVNTDATHGRLYVVRDQSLWVVDDGAAAQVPVGSAPPGALYLGELDGEPCFAHRLAEDGDRNGDVHASGVQADFTCLSALELMSLGDRERVHTALLSWLLGQDSPLPPMSRGRVAAALAGVEPAVVTSTMSSTEVKNLDVLIELEGPTSWSLAVEGKLKAREHSDQLARYSAQLAGRTRQPSKVLLSLAGDAPGVLGWRAVSYEQLASALRAERANGLGANPYARDYLSMVERLAAAVGIVESEAGACVVFDESDEEPTGAPGFRDFVMRLRLSKVLQQTWMMRLQALVLALAPLPALWNTEIDETRGAALVNFQGPLDDCRVGLQVQHRSLKMFSYPLSEAPSPARIAASADVLAEMAKRFGTDKAPSRTRARGFSGTRLRVRRQAGTSRRGRRSWPRPSPPLWLPRRDGPRCSRALGRQMVGGKSLRDFLCAAGSRCPRRAEGGPCPKSL